MTGSQSSLSFRQYRSHFAPMVSVEAFQSPQDYAREVALTLVLAVTKVRKENANQLPLF